MPPIWTTGSGRYLANASAFHMLTHVLPTPLGVMSRQVVFDSADGRGSDRGVVPVMIVEVQPARECFAALSL